jgi:hypothetical protein
MTALAGHLRHLLAVAAASNQLDLRDWMRPEDPAGLLNRICEAISPIFPRFFEGTRVASFEIGPAK